MVNKDYILRMAEKFGRSLAIILHLREYNQLEEALIYTDDTMLQMTGLTPSFVNSVPDEILIKAISPLGKLNVDKCLWLAVLLSAEGDIYQQMDRSNESYYRYLKALTLYLLSLEHETVPRDSVLYKDIDELLNKLEEYDLPLATKEKLLRYYELVGKYDKAENVLFEALEADAHNTGLRAQGIAFYDRLRAKSNAELLLGNFSSEEVEEGLTQLTNT